jgi:hypothetical protein
MCRTPLKPSLTTPLVAITGTAWSTGEPTSSHRYLALECRRRAHFARQVRGVVVRLHVNTFLPLSHRVLSVSHAKITRRARIISTR